MAHITCLMDMIVKTVPVNCKTSGETKTIMNVTDAVLGRRTTRGFLPDPVPHEIIREVLDTARHAPSNSNTQPWHVAVVSGAARDALEREVFAASKTGETPNPAWPPGGVGLTGAYKDRQNDCAFRYYDTMGIDRSDKVARMQLVAKNWQFFGAPHAAFLSMPLTMHRANALDLGILLQTIMLLLTERGIGCIAQGALAMFPDLVREVVDIPDENGILCGLSFGYVDEEAHINTAKMPREPLDAMTSFAG